MIMVALTDAAASKMLASLRARGGGIGIRIGVKTSGCSGLAYLFEYADAVDEGDEVIESKGVCIIVDRKSLFAIEGTTIDYVKKGLNEGFEFINPRETARCGCGESFSVG